MYFEYEIFLLQFDKTLEKCKSYFSCVKHSLPFNPLTVVFILLMWLFGCTGPISDAY